MKKGFATSAILYTMLLLFLILMTGILNNLQNKKTILDALKKDTVSALEQDIIIDAILDQIAILHNRIVTLEEQIIELEKEYNPTECVLLLSITTPPLAGEDYTLSDDIRNYSKIVIRLFAGYTTQYLIDVKSELLVAEGIPFSMVYHHSEAYRYFFGAAIANRKLHCSLFTLVGWNFGNIQVYGIR